MSLTTTGRGTWLLERLAALATADRVVIHVDRSFVDELLLVLHRAATLPDTIVLFGAIDEVDDGIDDHGRSRFVVTAGETAVAERFDHLSDTDFAVAVGGDSPRATLRVDGINEAGALLDALLRMRSRAQRGNK